MKKKPSLKDIAKKVGVSIATVSYVLSKGKESKVSEEVTKKVKAAAKELNYQPNQIAKSLKSGKTFTIGLIVADISNPFFANIARIVEDEAAKLNYTVIFGSSDEKAEKSWDLIQFLINRQVDGFIIAPSEGSEKQIEYLKEQHIPFVLIDRNFPEIATSYVILDNYKASYQAVERLIEGGNTDIGMLAYEMNLHHMNERIRGYEEALMAHGLTYNKNYLKHIPFSNVKEGVEKAIDEFISKKFTVNSLFFATNTLAVHGLKYLDKLNYTIPDDLTIVSFDEGEAFDFYYCPLTFIKQPLSDFGKHAVKVLINNINRSDQENQGIILNGDLIIRNSCRTISKK